MIIFPNAKEKMYLDGFFQMEFGDIAPDFLFNLTALLPEGDVTVDELVLAFQMLDLDCQKWGTDHEAFFPFIPQYIDRVAPPEFAIAFRKQFNRDVLGFTQEELPEGKYSVIEVEDGILDISNKSRAEVVAALYNGAFPVGMGFAQYNPIPWTPDIAEQYISKCATLADGSISFTYVMGRSMQCGIKGDLLFIKGYNADNGPGAAQRAVATCKDYGAKKLDL